MLLICHPTCTTCQKARDFLHARGVMFTERDIREENPSVTELSAWQKTSGLPLKRFFNTSGILYRQQGLTEKLPLMSEAAQLRLLATDGMLVRRPILLLKDRVLVGFKEKEWAQALDRAQG